MRHIGRHWLLLLGALSGLSNVLALSGSVFMLQVYDRVIPSRSGPTLVALLAILAILVAFNGLFDLLRSRLAARLGARFDERASRHAYLAAISGKSSEDPLRDVEAVRSGLSGPGFVALLDLPWIPVYLAFAFLLHPSIGWLTTAGAAVLVALTVATGLATRASSAVALDAAVARQTGAVSGRRHAETLAVLGMTERFVRRWARSNTAHLRAQTALADTTAGFATLSKTFRVLLQSLLLALGAWLVITGELTGGAIIAASIAGSRALAPVEMAIAHWRAIRAAVAANRRLRLAGISSATDPEPRVALPAPTSRLQVEGIVVTAPGANRAILNGIGFEIAAGSALVLTGRSASGKTTLARTIVGAVKPARGTVRIDGATLDQWGTEALGPHVGYMPQEPGLPDATIAETIARFEPSPIDADIVAAARAAGIHEMVLSLPDGYETRIGDDGRVLSSGQRQRLALARALYREPFLVVLDEPNANLDSDGDKALADAVAGVRARGGIAIIVSHRANIMEVATHRIALDQGRIVLFDEIRRAAEPVAIAA